MWWLGAGSESQTAALCPVLLIQQFSARLWPTLWWPQRLNRQTECACSDVATANVHHLDVRPFESWHFLGYRVFIWDIWRSLPALPAPLARSVALFSAALHWRWACCCCCRVHLRSESAFRARGDENYWPEKMNGDVPPLKRLIWINKPEECGMGVGELRGPPWCFNLDVLGTRLIFSQTYSSFFNLILQLQLPLRA